MKTGIYNVLPRSARYIYHEGFRCMVTVSNCRYLLVTCRYSVLLPAGVNPTALRNVDRPLYTPWVLFERRDIHKVRQR